MDAAVILPVNTYIEIRNETEADIGIIAEVTVAAFETLEISQHTESFGFENVDGLKVEGVPQEVFFALSLDGHMPRGEVHFHEGFKASGPPSEAGAVIAEHTT